MLTTRGWRTGRETSTPLSYARDGERVLIAASFAGSGRAPVWYHNLVVHPDVTVTIDGRVHTCRARTLAAEEAALAWPKLIAVYSTFTRYLGRARRTIPVIELSPIPIDRTGAPAVATGRG